jgi:dCMP deaminase
MMAEISLPENNVVLPEGYIPTREDIKFCRIWSNRANMFMKFDMYDGSEFKQFQEDVQESLSNGLISKGLIDVLQRYVINDFLYDFSEPGLLMKFVSNLSHVILVLKEEYKLGINRKEPEISEGNSFADALTGYEKDTSTCSTDKSEWQKYIDGAIVPTHNPTGRINKIEYYLGIAKAVAQRGTCLRRKFGAVIVKDDRIVSTGYVGAPRGRKNCCDIGKCFRQENNIPSGQRYELCRSVHAEMNAIISASKEELQGGVMYLVGIENDGSTTPHADCCAMCKRMIINAGIRYVIIAKPTGSIKVSVQDWITNDDSLALHEGY